jgi:hypothetical protein
MMRATMPDLTIAIPCSPKHTQIVERAVASCVAQTAKVLYGVWPDKDGKGAGWARNRLLDKVTTPFIAFLDADDTIEPDFAARMLAAAYENSAKYVYCGWYADEMGANGQPQAFSPPERCYCFDTGCLVHPVTAVIPTNWARAIGGFDENLPGMEDTEFFLRLTAAGHCGYRLDEPLFHWTPAVANESRSWLFKQRPDYMNVKKRIADKYNRGVPMPCCGGPGKKMEGPYGSKQDGDVLAHMLGTPLLSGYVGRVTRRIYPGNAGYGALVWAHPGDVQADPQRFAFAAPPAAPTMVVEANLPPAVSSAADVAAVFEGYARDGNDVYLPQNDTPSLTGGRITPSALRKLAGL